MNEATWRQVAEWERLHEDACPDARLLRFMGRPDDLRCRRRRRRSCRCHRCFGRRMTAVLTPAQET